GTREAFMLARLGRRVTTSSFGARYRHFCSLWGVTVDTSQQLGLGHARRIGRFRHVGQTVTVVVVLIAALSVPVLGATTAMAASTIAGTLSQCTNGALVGGTSGVTLEQCAGANGSDSVAILNGQSNKNGYENWVSGNSNSAKSHWREGDFIAYRTEI